MGAHLLECSGNGRHRRFGLMSAAEWSGVQLSTLLERLEMARTATRVLVSGFDGHSGPHSGSRAGASWVFTFAELETQGAFLATRMNGAPLPKHHGQPVRLIMPGWYGCTCIKGSERGRYRIELRVNDPRIRTRRLDRGFYARTVELTAV